jgi:hypothetical protein
VYTLPHEFSLKEANMTAKAIPEGYHTLTPYMTVRDAARAIEFYKQAFGAVEKGVMKGPDGKIMHAELRIGDSLLMLADEFPQFGSLSPQTIGGSPARDCTFMSRMWTLLLTARLEPAQPWRCR